MKYNFDAQIDRLGTHSVKWDFLKETYGREDLLPFTIADSDFAVAPEIVQALIDRVNRPAYGYTSWDQSEFRTVIAQWFAQQFATEIDKRSIVYGPNVIYMIKAILLLLEQKREGETFGIILQNPAYEGFINLLRALGYEIAVWDFVTDRGDFGQLKSLCACSDNAVLLLAHPHNPTGVELAANELSAMLQICQQHDIFVISDEIHMDFVYQPLVHTPIIKVAAELKMLERVALISSGSKTFNISGLQCGYMVLPWEDLRDEYVHELRYADNFYGASIMGLTALMAGYEHGTSWLDAMKTYVATTIDWIEQFIVNENLPIGFRRPDATYIIWLDVSRFGLSEDEMMQQLVMHGVVLARGSHYQLLDEGSVYVRVNISTNRERVKQVFYALQAINQTVKGDKKE